MTVYTQINHNKLKSVILIVGFVLFIIGLGVVLSYAYEGGIGGIILAIIISMAMALFSYYGGDKVALLTNGAHGPIKLEDNPYVYRLVENLAITAGLPMPKVYLITDAAPNAFATGRDPQHASIAVTTGIIELLKNEELEGVLAHELSHIKNFDIRLMTVIIICVGIVNLLAQIFLRVSSFSARGGSAFGGSGNRGRGNQVTFAFTIIGLILLIFSPIVAKIIQLAISRKREFLADASGALLTRYPEGLARALEKIAAGGQSLQRANTATAHLFFANPFGSHRRWLNIFSTHPPVTDRIAALRSIA